MKLFKFHSAIFILAILPLCTTFAQSNEPKFRQQIKAHKIWMAEHSPNLKNISDSALIIETIDAIYSICLEPQVIALMQYAGNKYGLPDLLKYSEIRKRQDIDRDDSLARCCLWKLAETSKQIFGLGSFPEAYAYLILTQSAPTRKDLKHDVPLLVSAANQLIKRDSIPINHRELWLLAQLKSLNGWGFEENPFNYIKYLKILKQALRLNEEHHNQSLLHSYLQQGLWQTSKSFLFFQTYYSYVLRVSHSEFPQSVFMQEWLTRTNTDSEIRSTFLKGSLQSLIHLYHRNHPSVLLAEASLLYEERFQRFDVLPRLCEIRDYMWEYESRYHYNAIIVDSYIRDCEILFKNDKKNTSCRNLINIAKLVYSTANDSYRDLLKGELVRQIIYSTESVDSLAQELKSIESVSYAENEMEDLFLRTYSFYLQRHKVVGYESAFSDLVQEYIDKCDLYPSWTTISLGKMLVVASGDMGDFETSFILKRKIIQLLRQFIGDENPLFVLEIMEYGIMLADNPTMTYDETEVEATFDEILSKSKTVQMESLAYYVKGTYLVNNNQKENGRYYLKKALNLFDKELTEIIVGDSILKGGVIVDKARTCANLIQSFMHEGQQGQQHIDSINFYGNILRELCNDIPFNGVDNWNVYKTLCTCYALEGNYKTAKETLHKCLSYYDNIKGYKVDGAYLEIIHNLIEYMGAYENNMDECQALVERLQEDLKGFENYGWYDGYIQLFINLYTLIESKNPYDLVILSRYLDIIENAVNIYWEASQHNDKVWYNYRLLIYSKWLNFISMEDNYRQIGLATNANMEEFEKGYQVLKKYIVEIVIPDLDERCKQLKSLYGNQKVRYLNYYVNILFCQAIAAEYCIDNQDVAEKNYREISNFTGVTGLVYLCEYFLRHNKLNAAIHTARQIDSLYHDPQSFDMVNLSANLYGKSRTLGTLFTIYYKARQINNALRVAREFWQHFSTFVQSNFDFMTQNERVGFIMTYGSGSAPIINLLPHMPDELAGEAYNLTLREKGLLLRSFNRIQQAISKSGDKNLLAAIDTLHLLQNKLATIQNTNTDAVKQFTNTREQIDRLERYVSRQTAQFRLKKDVVPSWQQVRDNLRKDEAAVEYLFSDSVCMALIVTPDCSAPKYVKLMNFNEYQDLMKMIIGRTPVDVAKLFYEQKNILLYNKLWKPLEPYFQDAKEIYYAPSQILSTLSFAAFVLEDGSYLIDHYELHQLTSTAQIAYRKNRKEKKFENMSMNIYSAIYYNSEQKEYYEPRLVELRNRLKTNSGKAQYEKYRGQAESFPFLEWSLLEADVLESTMKSLGVKTIKEIGSIPTEETIRNLSGSAPDILHISTHGFFYNDFKEALRIPYFQKHQTTLSPMTCTGLILADGECAWDGEDMPEESDNILTSFEVSTIDLSNTDLVVLSACETGLGGLSSEGIWGLQRGFKQAGVNSICASLWSVNDLTTAELISSFLSNWLSDPVKINKHKAMKEAMLKQRIKTPSPVYWAPFVLYDADL